MCKKLRMREFLLGEEGLGTIEMVLILVVIFTRI